MGLKADYYEALTWHALARIHGEEMVCYEPDRRHYPQTIYTTPDFLVNSSARPLFVHVCYWDSKETSHAKFWRTVSEIAELKCFVPGCRSLCVVFETSLVDGVYQGVGWYSEFLKGLHLLADAAVFYNVPHVNRTLERLKKRLPARAGTTRIYREIATQTAQRSAVDSLEMLLRRASPAPPRLLRTVRMMWQREQRQCATLAEPPAADHRGERLRDAALQAVLLMMLFDWSAPDVLNRLTALFRLSHEDFPGRRRMVDWMSRLPVRYRKQSYTFLVADIQEFGHLPIRCVLSDDLQWMVRALHANRSPLPAPIFRDCLEEMAAAYRTNPQIVATVLAIRSALEAPPLGYTNRSAKDWTQDYESQPADAAYNRSAELLIEAIGLGTYPLVRAYNERHSASPITRDDVRGLYSNRRAISSATRRRHIVRNLAKMIPADVNWESVHLAYLHRKVRRIVGPQSDINPMNCFVRNVLRNSVLPQGFTLVDHQTLDTFASSVAKGTQLGTWRVSLALRSDRETIPLFTSAMRDPQDCAHKVCEFVGHLRLARHTLVGNRVSGTRVRRGIAILEGGYGNDDKAAFQRGGYIVCSLDTLAQVVAELR